MEEREMKGAQCEKRTIRVLCILSCALLVLGCVAPVAMAQETTAGIQGVVKDPTGAVVSGATVELSSPALMGTKKEKTDGSGAYRFSSLPPGEYTLTVTAGKFNTYKQTHIDLSAGRLPTIDVQLQIGAVSEVMEVTAAAPVV